MNIYFGGGLNEQQRPLLHEAGPGSINFELSKDRNAMIPRAPFDLIATTPNAGDVRGFMQLIKRDGTVTTVVQSGAVVYSWDGATTFTSVGTPNANSKLRGTYWSLDDYLVVTDLQKLTPVSNWDGTTFSTQTTGLGATLYAKYGIVHDGRMWLFNVTTATDTPHLMVASAFEDPTSYDTTQRSVTGTFATGLEAFYILTPDLRAINGVAKTLAGDLIISTQGGALFKLMGSDADTYEFKDFFPNSNAISDEAIASIGNDIIYMRRHGGIDLLSATQNYGDVASDDLSRWIPKTTRGLDSAIVVYDQGNQKVLFFVLDKVLVFFKDIFYGGALSGEQGGREAASPWSVYSTQDTSGYNTNAAFYGRVPGTATDYTVYFGSDDGRIFNFNGTGSGGDAGTEDIICVRAIRHIAETDQVSLMNGANKMRIEYKRLNQCPFNVSAQWDDELSESVSSVQLKGDVNGGVSYYNGAYHYNGQVFYGSIGYEIGKISHINSSFVGKGPGVTLICSTTSKRLYQVNILELL